MGTTCLLAVDKTNLGPLNRKERARRWASPMGQHTARNPEDEVDSIEEWVGSLVIPRHRAIGVGGYRSRKE
jgi:hypothetical protein